jgi:hypothetical protein
MLFVPLDRCDVSSIDWCKAKLRALVSGGVMLPFLLGLSLFFGGDFGFHFLRFRLGERIVDVVAIDAVDRIIGDLFTSFSLLASASVDSR